MKEIIMERKWSFEYEGEEQYSLDFCYDYLEAKLKEDDFSLLCAALLMKGERDFEITGVDICMVHHGWQEGIFRVDVALNGGGKTIALAAGISRHPKLNQFVKTNHDTLRQMRSDEAKSHGMAPDDPSFKPKATMPEHYNDCEGSDGEPYFYLAEYLKEFSGIAVFAGANAKRSVYINRSNVDGASEFLDDYKSQRIVIDIFVHQVSTAIRCSRVLSPDFGSGDYMYDPNAKKVMLSCYRPPEISNNPLLAYFKGSLADGEVTLYGGEAAQYAAMQIAHLLICREQNLAGAEYFDSDKLHFSFNKDAILTALRALSMDCLLLRKDEWRKVMSNIRSIGVAVLAVFERDPKSSKATFEVIKNRFDYALVFIREYIDHRSRRPFTRR